MATLEEAEHDEDALELIRAKRLAQLAKSRAQQDEWRARGHGAYSELPDEKAFFDDCKKSQLLVLSALLFVLVALTQ